MNVIVCEMIAAYAHKKIHSAAGRENPTVECIDRCLYRGYW